MKFLKTCFWNVLEKSFISHRKISKGIPEGTPKATLVGTLKIKMRILIISFLNSECNLGSKFEKLLQGFQENFWSYSWKKF